MIKINLLPVKGEKVKERGRQQILVLVLTLIVVGGALIFWFKQVEEQIEKLNSRLSSIQGEIVKLDEIIGEVNQFSKQLKALETKVQVINKLEEAKTGPVQMLDEIAKKIPKKVWLSTLNEEAGSIILTGEAVDYEDVSEFMNELNKCNIFNQIKLKFTHRQNDPERQISFIVFEIQMNVNRIKV